MPNSRRLSRARSKSRPIQQIKRNQFSEKTECSWVISEKAPIDGYDGQHSESEIFALEERLVKLKAQKQNYLVNLALAVRNQRARVKKID